MNNIDDVNEVVDIEYNFSEVGKRIQSERIAADLTQEELANKSGCTRQSISKWEKGQGTILIECMLRMCKVFNCDLGYLLCEYDCRTRVAEDLHDLGFTVEVSNRISKWSAQVLNLSENFQNVSHPFIDLLNEIVLGFDLDIRKCYTQIQSQREYLNPVNLKKTPGDPRKYLRNLSSDVSAFREIHPECTILDPVQTINNNAREIARAIETILRGDNEQNGET